MTIQRVDEMNLEKNSYSYTQIFLIFLKLGCVAFGGPAAHLVFFHKKFVQELKLLDEVEYAQVVALAQILPGPSSSQVGIAIGYLVRGYWGAVCAWLGFTLPSALLMAVIAIIGLQATQYLNHDFFHVIQLIVLAVVTWAFWQMMKSLCHQKWQYILMFAVTIFIYCVPNSMSQILVILVAAILGILLRNYTILKPKNNEGRAFSAPILEKHKRFAPVWLIAFIIPFFALTLLHMQHPSVGLESVEVLYRTASLVFGGGHVILPLLHQDLVVSGLVSEEQFNLGYATAQLMPGPLFSFASYLGVMLQITDSVVLNVIIATVVIFIPSFFLMFAALPYWSWCVKQNKIFHAVLGINAAVVGVLLCLVVQMTQKYVMYWMDFVFVLIVILLLKSKIPVWLSLISSFIAYFSVLQILN